MQSLREIRMRLHAVKETLKFTGAMQLVSGVKLRRAQTSINTSLPYARRMHWLVRNLHNRYCLDEGCSPLLSGHDSDRRHLLLVVSSDRGLCGAFNSNVVKTVSDTMRRRLAAGKDVRIFCVGRKAYRMLKGAHQARILDVVDNQFGSDLTISRIEPLSQRILSLFAQNEFDVCCQIYTKFVSPVVQVPKSQQLVPVRFTRLTDHREEAAQQAVLSRYEFEPDDVEVLNDLLPHYITAQIYRSLLESHASEQAARHMAMERASHNAKELIKSQTLLYNKLRQLRITNEINEIVSGIR